VEHKTVKLAQCEMHYVEVVPVDKEPLDTLIFLHGFPEAWFAWTEQLDYFSKSYRVIAPDLPGYNLSEKVEHVEFYEVPNLIAVIKNFVEAVSNGNKVTLIAHDWGGAIAWPLAAFYSQLFSRLIILNAAHPSTFTREMIDNVEQRRRSDYIHELIASDAIDNLQKDNFSYLQSTIWKSMSGIDLQTDKKQQYIEAWAQKNALRCMLKYYQAMPQLAPSTDATHDAVTTITNKMTIPNIRVTIPTYVLWGEQDQAFVIDVLRGLEAYVTDLKIKRFENATHWLHHEIPEDINSTIDNWLSQNRKKRAF
jgi:pimeloyl-ACP methyl ester carboxylesterase